MPNFNGAIVMHALQELKSPATLREVVTTIAKHTELPTEDLVKPVKQTLEAGYRTGYLQRANGRYFVVSMSFEALRADVLSLAKANSLPEIAGKAQPKAKRSIKEQQQPQQVHQHRQILRQHQQQQQHLLKQQCSFPPAGQAGQDNASTTTLIPLQSVHLQRKPKRPQLSIK